MQEGKTSGAAVAVDLEQSEPWVTRYGLDQRLLHWVHTIAFLGLVGTGILLLPIRRLPLGLDFRGWIGGYSNIIMSWHNWLAISFVSFPLAVFLVNRLVGRNGEQDRIREGISNPVSPLKGLNLVKKVHLWITILMASAFVLTGTLMWARSYLSFFIVEWSYSLHDILTYLSIPLILGHLVVLHLLGAPEAMRGMILGKVSKEWAESVSSSFPKDK